jgi:hypothetical protein
MPSPNHVDTYDKGRYGHESRDEGKAAENRRGIGEYSLDSTFGR